MLRRRRHDVFLWVLFDLDGDSGEVCVGNDQGWIRWGRLGDHFWDVHVVLGVPGVVRKEIVGLSLAHCRGNRVEVI